MNKQHIAFVKALLTPRSTHHRLIRVGSSQDGGYVVSEDLLNTTTQAWSLGTGDDISFDRALTTRGIKVLQYDHTVPNPYLENAEFYPIEMNSQSFQEQLLKHRVQKQELLKMDIECSEYELILNTPMEKFERFSQITLELHNIIWDNPVQELLMKLSSRFILVHLHANNTDHTHQDEIANVLELTWIHLNHCLPKVAIASPNPLLDYPNDPTKPSITQNWWVCA